MKEKILVVAAKQALWVCYCLLIVFISNLVLPSVSVIFKFFFFRRTTYCLCLCVCLFVVAAISNSISVLYCNRFY